MNEQDLLKLLQSLAAAANNNNNSRALEKKEHRFWNTQPVCISDHSEDGPINPPQPLETIRSLPYALPSPYEFCTVDLADPGELDEVHQLLRDNYVEDVDEEFRFEYSKNFLQWALMPPGYQKDWHVGVRLRQGCASVADASDSNNSNGSSDSNDSSYANDATASVSNGASVANAVKENDSTEITKQNTTRDKLVAFIAAIPCGFRVRKAEFPRGVEVNFLCICKSLRSKRLAPMLIREVTRRVNLLGIFQAIYTAGIELPAPYYTAQYYHRPLRVDELIQTGFCPPGTIEYPLGTGTSICPSSSLRLRRMQPEDLPAVRGLLDEYLCKFQLAAIFPEPEDAAHWLLPSEGVMYSYVSEDASAFVSFYSIPTTVLNPASSVKQLQVAYLSYYAVKDDLQVLPLIKAVMREAHQLGFHVFNALNVMGNTEDVLQALRFGPGDGKLRYYLYNWRTQPFEANQVGFIML